MSQFFEKDHLGSVRAVVNTAGVVSERNDYYPFGLRHANAAYSLNANNRFKFNGKEEQVAGNLGLLDYGARMYDNTLGRWTAGDPLAEKYYDSTPYGYAGNNPVLYVDPDGRQHGLPQNHPGLIDPVRWNRDREYRQALWDVTKTAMTFTDLNDAYVIGSALISPFTGGEAVHIDGTVATGEDIEAAKMGMFVPVGSGKIFSKAGEGLDVAGDAIRGAQKTATEPYTKSSLQRGREMHRAYKAEEAVVGDGVKEFMLPSHRRIDYLDVQNRTIHELKPNNPRGVQQGERQLDMYMKELQTMPEYEDFDWNTSLDLY